MKKNIRLTLKSVSLLPLMLLSLMAFEAQAETASFKTTISRILITEGKYGNCMVRLDTPPQSQLPNCGNYWVSFSCDGSYTSQDVAYRMLEMSQMAYVLEKEVFIQIDDSRKHNGYCLAYRVDLMQ
jgi:hypothetical protein